LWCDSEGRKHVVKNMRWKKIREAKHYLVSIHLCMWIFIGLQLLKWLSWWCGQDIIVLMFNSHSLLSVGNYCICIHSTVLCTTGRRANAINQAALKALQAAGTSPLVQQRQKALNDITTQQAVGQYWFPGHTGVRGNKITNKFARGSADIKVCWIWASFESLQARYEKWD